MIAITTSNIKNRYLYLKMKVVKKDRPYYAKWWFFIGLLTLGWLTPITKHWQLFLFGETTTAFPIKKLNQYQYYQYYHIYVVDGNAYNAYYENELGKTPDDKGITILYNPDNPSENLSFQFSLMYSDEHLFFPVGFQIAFGVFFLMIRFKDL